MSRPLRVFLCHSSNDKPTVRELYQKLRAETWIEPWLDEEELYPGQDWNMEIEKAVEAADAIIVCLSKGSITKEGYVQRELRTVLDFADYKPEGTLYIIPVRLEECEPPRRLRAWQYADYFEGQRERAFQRLLVSLKRRAAGLGLTVEEVDRKQIEKQEKTPQPEIKKSEEKNVSAPINEELKEEPKQEIPAKPFTKLLAPSSLTSKGISHPQGVAAEKAASEKAKHEPKQNSERKNEGEPSIDNQGLPFFSKINQDPSVFIPQVLFSLFMLVLLAWGAYTMFSSNTPKQPVDSPVLTATAFSPTDTTKPELPTETPQPIPSLTMTGAHGETLVYVPKGDFTMGSDVSTDEKPVHTVYLDAFWIDQTEVTNKQYQACVKAGTCELPSSVGSYTHPSYYGNSEFDNYPVLYVTWDKANRYCEVWAGGDLPTEAQWEKAARGTDKRTYPWGEAIDCNKANYQSSCIGDTSPVGSYKSGKSPYEVYDMAGNVWEWVNDYYQSDYYAALGDSASNPVGPESGQYRVLRGGSWDYGDDGARSSFRFGVTPDLTDLIIGFRCARSLP